MAAEKIIEQMLLKHPEMSKEKIMEKLEKEKKRSGGLILDETLLRVIAAEFGINVKQGEFSKLRLLVKNLIPNLMDVTVVGRIVAVFLPKTFKGNRSGKIASLIVADQSGLLRVVFWNDKTRLIESGELKTGQIAQFSHGYTREDRGGKVEFHIGEKSEVKINPPNVSAEDYPTISRFAVKIREITRASKNRKVNLIGKIEGLFSPSVFLRQDSSSGKFMRFVLGDETGRISVVVWNDKVDELEKMFKEGVQLQIVNAKVKKALGDGVEVHVDSETYVETFEFAEEFVKIERLREGLDSVNVEGEVATKPVFREVKTSKGEFVKLATFELKGETGKIRISAWRKHAETAVNLKIGDKITLKNVYVKKGFSDQLELSTKYATSITNS